MSVAFFQDKVTAIPLEVMDYTDDFSFDVGILLLLALVIQILMQSLP